MGGVFETLSGAKAIRTAGRSAQNLADFNAAVAEQQAEAERKRAAFAQKRQAKKGAQVKSALTAKIAAAGGLGSPVAADLTAEQAAELDLESALIAFEGEVRARRAETQAEIDRLSGRVARQRGKAGARAASIAFGTQLATMPVTKTGGTLLTGF